MNLEKFKKENHSKEQIELFKAYSEAEMNQAQAEKTRNDLEYPFYKKLTFYVAISPLIIGLITYFGTSARGYFDNTLKEAQLEKREIQLDIRELEKKEEDLTKKKDSLIEYYNTNSKLLAEEYQLKKDSLENLYADQIESLTNEIEDRNKDASQRLKELETSKQSLTQTEKELRRSLQKEKEANSAIIKLSKKSSSDAVKIAKLTAENENQSATLTRNTHKIESLNRELLKTKVITYLLLKDWELIGFNRIKKNVDENITDDEIRNLYKRYPKTFSQVTLKDPDDKNGIKLLSNFPLNEAPNNVVNK
ncbi:MAG: hypothetical protein AAFX87_11235 [Bacteroidota bacterium]